MVFLKRDRRDSIRRHLSTQYTWVRRHYRLVGSVIAAVVLGVEILERVIPDPAPYIMVAATAPDANNQPAEFYEAFNSRFVRENSAVDVERRSVNDYNVEDRAHECVSEPDCLVFVGNSTSTRTSRSLDVFMQHDMNDRPVFVMPFATATDLTQRARDGNYLSVLRVVPDNDNQAETIARVLTDMDKGEDGPSVIIYIDEDNPDYSNGLARAVANEVRGNDGYVLAEEHIGPSNSALFTLTMWEQRANSPLDAVIYVGTAHHCLLLIDQMVQLNSTVPVVFTDGCSLDDFPVRTANLSGGAYRLSVTDSYREIGELTAFLVDSILDNCQDCNRRALTREVSNGKTTYTPITDARELGENTDYRFDHCGNNVAISFVVSPAVGGGGGLADAPVVRSNGDCRSPVTMEGR